MLRIKLVRSTIAQNPRNRATVKALGLGKIGTSVEVDENNKALLGMAFKVKHLLLIEDENGKPPFPDSRSVIKKAPNKDRLPGSSGALKH
jgi:large subunit ribosomal protein L30